MPTKKHEPESKPKIESKAEIKAEVQVEEKKPEYVEYTAPSLMMDPPD